MILRRFVSFSLLLAGLALALAVSPAQAQTHGWVSSSSHLSQSGDCGSDLDPSG